MARIELEIDDAKGEIVGEVPESLKGIFTRIETTAHNSGYGKGAQKAAEEAKAQIEKAIADAKARFDSEAPLKQAKYDQMETDYKGLQTRLIEQERAHGNTLKDQGEKHARELLERADRQNKLSARIQELTKASLRGEARAAGARDESLDELEVILHSSIGYDDDMTPFVRNGDCTPRTVQGKPMSIGAFVKEYLDSHAHHRRPAQGQGGGARGGASMHGHPGSAAPTADAARARIDSGDRSTGAINDLFNATRAKKTA